MNRKCASCGAGEWENALDFLVYVLPLNETLCNRCIRTFRLVDERRLIVKERGKITVPIRPELLENFSRR